MLLIAGVVKFIKVHGVRVNLCVSCHQPVKEVSTIHEGDHPSARVICVGCCNK